MKEIDVSLGRLLVDLGEYRGLSICSIEIDSSEELVDERVYELLDRVNVEDSTNLPAKMGDTVTFSCQGLLDGKELPTLCYEKCSVRIGSSQLIAGFEENLKGHASDDVFTFNLNFPAMHINRELQGHQAEFQIVILDVRGKRSDICSDAFVREVSDFESFAELRRAVSDQIDAENQEEMIQFAKESACDALVAITTVGMPDALIEASVQERLNGIRRFQEQKGETLESYYEQAEVTKQDLEKSLQEEARKDIILRCALTEIARREGLKVSSVDIAKEISEMRVLGHISQEDEHYAVEDAAIRSRIEDILIQEKALGLVLSNARIEKIGIENEM